jgi:hypothetical protein
MDQSNNVRSIFELLGLANTLTWSLAESESARDTFQERYHAAVSAPHADHIIDSAMTHMRTAEDNVQAQRDNLRAIVTTMGILIDKG